MSLALCTRGCGATYAIENLENHLLKCTLPCPEGCGMPLKLAELIPHKEDHCPKVMARCPTGCGMFVRRETLPAHVEVCPSVYVLCTGKCGQPVRRRLLEKHLHMGCLQPKEDQEEEEKGRNGDVISTCEGREVSWPGGEGDTGKCREGPEGVIQTNQIEGEMVSELAEDSEVLVRSTKEERQNIERNDGSVEAAQEGVKRNEVPAKKPELESEKNTNTQGKHEDSELSWKEKEKYSIGEVRMEWKLTTLQKVKRTEINSKVGMSVRVEMEGRERKAGEGRKVGTGGGKVGAEVKVETKGKVGKKKKVEKEGKRNIGTGRQVEAGEKVRLLANSKERKKKEAWKDRVDMKERRNSETRGDQRMLTKGKGEGKVRKKKSSRQMSQEVRGTKLHEEKKMWGGKTFSLKGCYFPIPRTNSTENFKVFRCPNECGCGNFTNERDLRQHNDRCPANTFTCPNECGSREYTREYLKIHLKSCRNILTACPKGCGIHIEQFRLNHHLEKSCSIVTCPKSCGRYVFLTKLVHHLQFECPNSIIACHKCNLLLLRKTLPLHFNTSLSCTSAALTEQLGCSFVFDKKMQWNKQAIPCHTKDSTFSQATLHYRYDQPVVKKNEKPTCLLVGKDNRQLSDNEERQMLQITPYKYYSVCNDQTQRNLHSFKNILACPNGCGIPLLKDELSRHLERRCPAKYTVPCPQGCKLQLQWRELFSHLTVTTIPSSRPNMQPLARPTQPRPAKHNRCFCCGEQHEDMEDHLKSCCNLIVPCPNNLKGCRRRLRRRELPHHLSRCDVDLVPCPQDCGVQIRRDSVGTHCYQSCALSDHSPCPNDDCKLFIRKVRLQRHISVCPEGFITCPNECGVMVKRKYVDMHSIETCRKSCFIETDHLHSSAKSSRMRRITYAKETLLANS